MKKITFAAIVLLLALLVWWQWQVSATHATFSGTLVDGNGKPLAGAIVTVGGTQTETTESGAFTVKGAWATKGRWVLDVRRRGYAPVSKVFNRGMTELDIAAVETTMQTFDPATIIVARDTRSFCIGAPIDSVDWGPHPVARFPRAFDANGDRVMGNLDITAQRALDFLAADQPCNSGFQVTIPASSLLNSRGRPPQGKVTVELSTVDIYSADGMPGDYSVETNTGGPAYMESFGAGTIEIRSGDELLQLRDDVEAELVIPVDRGQADSGSKIPETIPLLRYIDKTGEWRQIGSARLNRSGRGYVGNVSHFSEFNADVNKTNPACLAFDASGMSGNFTMLTTAPTSSGGFKQITHQVQPNSGQANQNLHAIFNLPPNEWVVVRAIRSGTPIGTWVFATPAPWGSTSAPAYPYSACGTPFAMSESTGTGITRSGANRRFGPRPKHVSYLVNTSGATEDVYPIGGTDCEFPCFYTFSLLDTGSNIALIDQVIHPILGLTTTPNANWDVDVRVNGFGGINSATLNAPFGTPGSAGGAQANTGVFRVAPRNFPVVIAEQVVGNPGSFVGVNYNLMGAPVANRVVAKIDYTTTITRQPYNFGGPNFQVTGPDIVFFMPGDTSIPAPNLTLFGQGFGSSGPNNTGETGQRSFLTNVTFSNGINNVYDEQTTTNPVRFLYDTGTAFTVISQAMASTLGVAPTMPNPSADCSEATPVNFVTISSITIVGMNASNQLATYTINNPVVCVDLDGSVITTQYPNPSNPSAGLFVDAVIGSNLFDQDAILWDGPKKTVGILP